MSLLGSARRHRHRVRLVLPAHGGRGDGVEVLPQILPWRSPRSRPSPARRSRSRHQDPHRRQGDEARKEVDCVTATIDDARQDEVINVDRVFWAVGVVGNIEASAREVWGEDRPQHHRDEQLWQNNVPASTPSATCVPPMLANMPSTRGSSASGDQGPPPPPMDKTLNPGCNTAIRRWRGGPHRGESNEAGRDIASAAFLRRQRQGDRPGRGPGMVK